MDKFQVIFSKREMRAEGENRRFFSSKGVSPLISTVLLIAIVIIVATLISSWLSGLSLEQSKTISNKTEGITSCSGSGIAIDDVYLDTAANISRVTVRNTGKAAELIVSAQILNKNGVNGTLNTSLPLSLGIGDIKVLVFNVSGSVPNCANFSRVRVATECTSDYYDRAPRNC